MRPHRSLRFRPARRDRWNGQRNRADRRRKCRPAIRSAFGLQYGKWDCPDGGEAARLNDVGKNIGAHLRAPIAQFAQTAGDTYAAMTVTNSETTAAEARNGRSNRQGDTPAAFNRRQGLTLRALSALPARRVRSINPFGTAQSRPLAEDREDSSRI
jgi:hypothetical protein